MSAAGSKQVKIIHYVITLLITFGVGFLPPVGAMTPLGMRVFGVFFGTIYGWTFIGFVWPSILGIIGLGLCFGMPKVLASTYGNPIVPFLLVMLPISGTLTAYHVIEDMVNVLLANKLAAGRPWLMVLTFIFTAYVAAVLNVMVAIILMCAYVVDLSRRLELQPFTKLPTSLLLGVAFSILMGQIIIPFRGTALTLNAAYAGMFGQQLPYGAYMLYIIPLTLIALVLFVLVMRFVVRVDASPLTKLTEPSAQKGKKKFSRDQKIVSVMFLLLIALLILMSMLPKTSLIGGGLQALQMYGITGLFMLALMVIRNESGKPLLDFKKEAAAISWDIVLLVAFVLVTSEFLVKPETGFGKTITMLIKPLTTLPQFLFIALALLVIVVLTQFANNVVLSIILMPVLMGLAEKVGMSGTALVILTFFVAHLPLATPAGSPMTGIAMSQTQIVRQADMMKTGAVYVACIFPVMLIIGILWMKVVF